MSHPLIHGAVGLTIGLVVAAAFRCNERRRNAPDATPAAKVSEAQKPVPAERPLPELKQLTPPAGNTGIAPPKASPVTPVGPARPAPAVPPALQRPASPLPVLRAGIFSPEFTE